MKNIYLKILIPTLLVLFLSSCSNDLVDYKLKIVSGRWDGWQEYTEEEMLSWQETKTYDVVKGLKIDDLQGWDDFSITIQKVSADSIAIKTLGPMSSSNSGIDMQSTQTKFILHKGDILTLNTLSYDAGFFYYLELVEEE